MATTLTRVSEPSNGAKPLIEALVPYMAIVTVEGTADLLFHRWDCEAVDEKSKARKNSKTKKTDNLESYIYRDDEGYLCVPSEAMRMCIVCAAKFQQDPRSPRKSAQDLFKAGIAVLEPLCRIKNLDGIPVKIWDYIHKSKVNVQRQGVTRCRPAIRKGWQCDFPLLVNLPEYIEPQLLNETIQGAGRFQGLLDYRPTYGRFNVIRFEVSN